MPSNKKLLERIKKVIALSENNPNEHERISAMERVQSLLAEHNLTMESVLRRPDHKFIVDEDIVMQNVTWRNWIGAVSAPLYFCQHLTIDEDNGLVRQVFIGEEHNVLVAKLMFAYFVGSIEEQAKIGYDATPAHQQAGYFDAFTNVAAAKLAQRIKDRLEGAKKGLAWKSDGSDNLPALRDIYDETADAIQEQTKKMFEVSTLPAVVDVPPNARGQRDGEKAGNGIGLDLQVPRSPWAKQIH